MTNARVCICLDFKPLIHSGMESVLDLESVGLILVLPLNMWPQHRSHQFFELVFLLCASSQGSHEDLMK